MQNIYVLPRKKKQSVARNFVIILLLIFIVMAGAALASQAIADESGLAMEVPVSGASGGIDITTSQAIGVVAGSVEGANSGRVITNDAGNAFQAPAEVHIGDQFTINLAMANKSNSPTETQIQITSPAGITVNVRGSNGAHGVVRLNLNTWAFKLDAGENDNETDISIDIAISDTARPGSYGLKVVIEPLVITGGNYE